MAMEAATAATDDGFAHVPSACQATGAYTGDLTREQSRIGRTKHRLGVVTPVVSGTGLSNFEITTVNGAWEIKRAAATAMYTSIPAALHQVANRQKLQCSAISDSGCYRRRHPHRLR